MRRPGAFTRVGETTDATGGDDGVSGAARVLGGIEIRTEAACILGFLVAECSRQGIGHIITIDIRPEARRHRLGSALLNSAESTLRSTPCRMVRLETAVDNVAAISFYKRSGYNVTRTIPRYYSTGVDALLLEKDLLSQVEAATVRT